MATDRADEGWVTISGLKDEPETARLLGNLTVAWSHAERVMYFAFWIASGTTQQKAFDIYESFSGFKARQDLTLSLLKHDAGRHPRYPELRAVYATLSECGKLRNELVHRTWVKNGVGELALLDHRMNRGHPTAKAVDDDQILELINRITTASDRFIELTKEMFPGAFESRSV